MEPLLAQLQSMSPAEVAGTVFGVLCVVLTVRAHVASWPAGIVSSLAYFALFLDVRLYADALLQLFFVATSLAGWRLWVRGGTGQAPLQISKLSRRERQVTAGWMVAAILVSAALFTHFTDASLPLADSTIAGMSLAAQLLLMRKKLESWTLWIAVDVLSIGVYFHKGIVLTGFLYCVFLVLAVRGHFEWKRRLRAARSTGASDTGSSSESSAPRTQATTT